MKKLAFLFAAVVAVSFASCGQKTEQGTCCDSDSIAAIEEPACCTPCSCDSCAGDSCACGAACDTLACTEAPAAE